MLKLIRDSSRGQGRKALAFPRPNLLLGRLGGDKRKSLFAGAGVVAAAVAVVSLLTWLAPDSDRPIPLQVVDSVLPGVAEQIEEQAATLLEGSKETVQNTVRNVREGVVGAGLRAAQEAIPGSASSVPFPAVLPTPSSTPTSPSSEEPSAPSEPSGPSEPSAPSESSAPPRDSSLPATTSEPSAPPTEAPPTEAPAAPSEPVTPPIAEEPPGEPPPPAAEEPAPPSAEEPAPPAEEPPAPPAAEEPPITETQPSAIGEPPTSAPG